MVRWREAHSALARDRYPSLVSFAALLTGADDTARALVDDALVIELSRSRREGSLAEVEEAVRSRIAREFVKGGEQRAPALARPPAAVAVAATPDDALDPHPSVFAPPGHEAGAPELAVPDAGPAPVEDEERAQVDLVQALAALTPLDRAIVVLHHAERLTPQRIARALGRDTATVRVLLARADQHLARSTGLAARPEAYAEGADQLEVTVEFSAGGRR